MYSDDMIEADLNATATAWHSASYRGQPTELIAAARAYISALEMKVLAMKQHQKAVDAAALVLVR